MLQEQQLATLLIKIAVSASMASILMRFARFQRIVFRDDRDIRERLQLALVFSLLFGGTAGVRILSHHHYDALDLALEGSVLAGMLGGYVSGLVTGLCASIPDVLTGHLMSMPLYAAVGILGGLMHDLAPVKEDVWHFSPFVDLNLYRLFRQVLQINQQAIQRRVLELAAFNVVCNAIVVLAEFLRCGIHLLFPGRGGTFFLFNQRPLTTPWSFAAVAATTLFAVSIPIRIWSSVRTEKQLEAQRARLTEARLAALTNQINPHFLFNTLNSVSTLIRIDPDRARSMVYKLSNILRRLLRKTESFSPLREELSFIDDYLAIETVRFGDKLRFHKEIDETTLDWPVPSMILQPIIENSIKHGLASKVEGGMVRLKVWQDETRLFICIEDDGVGIPESKFGTLLQQGIGVSNVNERLRVLFGRSYRFSVDSQPGQGTRTLIEIPEIGNRVGAMALSASERA